MPAGGNGMHLTGESDQQADAQWLHTTLPGLPGLLTERVLAKLNLRTLQSLWQTSRACRQMLANSQDVLAAFVQAELPGTLQYVSSYSLSQLRQELSAAAALHASLRRGQPLEAHDLVIRPDQTPEARLEPSLSQLSPSGAAAVLAWHHTAGPEGTYSLQPACSSAAGWLTPVPGASLSMPDQQLLAVGWSSGGLFGCAFCTSETQVAAHVFHTEQAAWLPAGTLHHDTADQLEGWGSIKFSQCESMLAACARSDNDAACQVLVFGVGSEQAGALPKMLSVDDKFSSVPAFEWLLGPPCLAVWIQEELLLHVAQVHAHGPASLQANSIRLQLLDPEASNSLVSTAMAVLFGGHMIILCVTGSRAKLHCEIAIFASSLEQRCLREIDLNNANPGELEGPCSVLASPHVLVIQLGRPGIWMFQLESPEAIGQLLCAVPDINATCFSPGGHLLAGFVGQDVCVLHGKTGACLMRLPPAEWWPGLQAVVHTADVAIRHVAFGGSQLLVTANYLHKQGRKQQRRAVDAVSGTGPGVLFVALQF